MCVFGLNCAKLRPLGSHHSRCCYLESTKADWQYEYDFKTLSSILAMFVFRPKLCNVCLQTKLCNVSTIAHWTATTAEAVFCKAIQADRQYVLDFKTFWQCLNFGLIQPFFCHWTAITLHRGCFVEITEAEDQQYEFDSRHFSIQIVCG